MKLLFCWRQYHQSVGGVERMSIELMNEMVRRGHQVHLLSWDQANAVPHYRMDPAIMWHTLGIGDHTVRANLPTRIKRILAIRKIVRSVMPDVMMAFMDGPFFSLYTSSLGLGIPTIEAERVSVDRFSFLKNGDRKKRMAFAIMRFASRITVQIEGYRRDYPPYLRHKIVSICNPVFPAKDFAKPEGDASPQRVLLSVGRLSYQKNFAVLIRAFALIAHKYPAWVLRIAGDGEDRDALRQLAAELGITPRVEFLGAVKNVQEIYVQSHLFCLPSRWEGFPNALAEALAHGLPAVGFEKCLGIPDLIDHGRSGLVARNGDNSQSLADCLDQLMGDDMARKEMGKAASESMRPYTPDQIFNQWEHLFSELAGGK